MDEVALALTKEDGEISDIDATVQVEPPGLVIEKVEDETTKGEESKNARDDENKASKRHKSSKPSNDHPCNRRAFGSLHQDLSKKGRLGEMPRYKLFCFEFCFCFFLNTFVFVVNMLL